MQIASSAFGWSLCHHDCAEREPGPSDAFLRSRILLSAILDVPARKALIVSLTGEDAQCIVDFLDRILREKAGILATEEGISILSLLYALAQSAYIFPKCYELKGINPNEFQYVAAGVFSEIFRARYQNRTICLRATGRFSKNGHSSVAAKEFVMWAHLSHENIFPFYGVYFLGKRRRLCLVCPWVENDNIIHYLRNFPQCPRLPLISDIVNGLLYLHQLMIIHGNLKGSNILISDDGRALIAGFALSSVAASGQGLDDVVGGTVNWTAPELFEEHEDGSPSSTPESDIWSLGCLCYEVLASGAPFDQYDTTDKIISAIMERHEIPSRPKGRHRIDDHMWNLMVKCWDYNPRNRPSCEEIWRFVMDLGIRDSRPPRSSQRESNVTDWEAIRATWDSKIDYQRVYDVLIRILRAPDLDSGLDLAREAHAAAKPRETIIISEIIRPEFYDDFA